MEQMDPWKQGRVRGLTGVPAESEIDRSRQTESDRNRGSLTLVVQVAGVSRQLQGERVSGSHLGHSSESARGQRVGCE